jgi:hypothetical protein
MDRHPKPLRWEDTAARHDPASLPFWAFYREAGYAQVAPQAKPTFSWPWTRKPQA